LSSVPSRGELYDWEQAHVIGRSEQDLAFVRDLIDPGATALELGCGTGRLTAPLFDSGRAVVGLDSDLEMLGAARARHAGVPLVCADARSFGLARRFDVVLAPYNFLQLLLTAGDRQQCMAMVTTHLAVGGTFAFEVHDFLGDASSRDVAPEPLHEGPLGDAVVTLHGGLRHDHVRRVTTYTRRFDIALTDGSHAAVDDDVALYSFAPGELDALLAGAGLTGHRRDGGAIERWTAHRIG
jgi:trans-aconitate methyltransferase